MEQKKIILDAIKTFNPNLAQINFRVQLEGKDKTIKGSLKIDYSSKMFPFCDNERKSKAIIELINAFYNYSDNVEIINE